MSGILAHRGLNRVGDERGLALMAALFLTVVMAVLVTAALTHSMAILRSASADYRSTRSFYAAEGAAEAIMGELEVKLQDGVISDDDISSLTPPVMEGYDFSGYNVQKVDTPRVEQITDGPYAGLYALTEDVEIFIPATDEVGNHSAVTLNVKAQAIPIFQFGVFYEEDLEIHPGPPMDFLGRVHTNGRLYLNANEARFHELLTTPSIVVSNYKHKYKDRDGIWIKDAGTDFTLLKFDSRIISNHEAFKARSCADFDCRLQTEAFGVEELNLPLPDGMSADEVVRPKEAGDGTQEQETKLAWKADTYVTVDLNNVLTRDDVCNDGGSVEYPEITIAKPLGGVVPNDIWKCKMFEWRWEGFVDSREKKPVDVLDIDINEVKNWVNDGTGHKVRLIYVEVIPNSGAVVKPSVTDPTGDLYYPAVRVANAQELPGPLTTGTDQPIYLWGDYNTVNKQPSAVAGDAYHVLSNAWDDSEHQVIREYNDLGLTDASPTTINVAIMAGHSATTCDINEDPGCTTAEYGGGFENYPRFLEHWSGVPYVYRGSIVSLWEAKYALGTWYRGSDDYYKPPVRDWGFDLDLRNPAKMPPGTPFVGAVIRTSFRESY